MNADSKNDPETYAIRKLPQESIIGEIGGMQRRKDTSFYKNHGEDLDLRKSVEVRTIRLLALPEKSKSARMLRVMTQEPRSPLLKR